MNKEDLKALCKERKIKGITGKRKEELIEMIKQRDTTPVSAPINEAKTDVKVEPEVNTEMNWNTWTDKSLNISFKSTTVGIGDGEEKVARELGTSVLGQNSCYDMKPIINGIPTECDVKKLDVQNDFNTGVKGRNELRPIKTKIVNLLQSIIALIESTIFTSEEKILLKSFLGISPDELAVGTLKRLNSVVQLLNTKREKILESIPIVQPFTDESGPVRMTLDVYYMLCQKMGKPFPSEYSSYEDKLNVLNDMDNSYIQNPTLLNEDLNSLVNFLKETTLIIVDKNKGYMFISDINRVRFLRITRGHPRFQIVF
jgi:hypothetical protein